MQDEGQRAESRAESREESIKSMGTNTHNRGECSDAFRADPALGCNRPGMSTGRGWGLMLVAFRHSRRESLRLLFLGGAVTALAAGCSFPASLAVHEGSSGGGSPDLSLGGVLGLASGSLSAPSPTAVTTILPIVVTAPVEPSPTPGPETLLVGKTGGDGVYIRSSIKPEKKIKVWPDGTTMAVVGNDQTVDSRTWKNVRDPAGNVGWVPAQYLVPTPTAAKASTPSARPTATGTPDEAVGVPPARWNTAERDAFASGNVSLAAAQLRALGVSEVKGRAQNPSPAAVLESPARYYGTMLRLEGYVALVQQAPADSAIAQLLGLGVVHLLVSCRDGTVVDVFQLGTTGNARIGDLVAVYGLAAGQAKDDDRLAGSTTRLVLVTKLIEKLPK